MEGRMRRKILGIVILFVFCASVGAFAYEKKSKEFPFMASYNKSGQLNFYAAVGFYGVGLEVAAGPEFIIQEFDLGGIPLEWGLTVRGMLGFGGFAGYSWLDWGVAPMATLHWGVDLGGIWKFDWYVGVGLGISGTIGDYYYWPGEAAIRFGFASFDGVAWQFADNMAVIVDAGYAGYVGVYGIGLRFNL
jgi:hypothetical protein